MVIIDDTVNGYSGMFTKTSTDTITVSEGRSTNIVTGIVFGILGSIWGRARTEQGKEPLLKFIA